MKVQLKKRLMINLLNLNMRKMSKSSYNLNGYYRSDLICLCYEFPEHIFCIILKLFKNIYFNFVYPNFLFRDWLLPKELLISINTHDSPADQVMLPDCEPGNKRHGIHCFHQYIHHYLQASRHGLHTTLRVSSATFIKADYTFTNKQSH